MVTLGILQVIHYIVLLLNINSKELWFWLLFALAFTFGEIKAEFSIVIHDGLFIQGGTILNSYLYIAEVFS